MRFDNLSDWLDWQESLNPKEIDLGLDRVAQVLHKAGRATTFDCPLITVAGTNGKGSVVAMLEAMTLAAGLNVCSYTSPHILRYNERIRINGQSIDDNSLCQAFEYIDQARQLSSTEPQQLTYFEFGTLAAIELFFREQPDLVIMEVGLGGRLDAVNIMDADVSVLTSIAVDHVDWLGDDREQIGFEKAGIFRADKAAICGDTEPPTSVLRQSEKLHCHWLQLGRQYRVIERNTATDALPASWSLESSYGDLTGLPMPALAGDFQTANAATAILALQVLQHAGSLRIQRSKDLASKDLVSPDSISVQGALTRLTDRALVQAIKTGLRKINLPGRYQQLGDTPRIYVDVAHNPQAAQALAQQLIQQETGKNVYRRTWSIVAMLADKDINGVTEQLADCIDIWCLAGLDNIARGLSAIEFARTLSSSAQFHDEIELTPELEHEFFTNQCTMLSEKVMLADSVSRACEQVLSKAADDDRIIIFGSFYTVAEAMKYFSM